MSSSSQVVVQGESRGARFTNEWRREANTFHSANMGNGAKAQQKRERNAKDAKKGPTSQLANNKAAMNLKCKICMQLFMNTSRAPQLQEHATNKHSKDIKDCFPDFQG
ncbi:hypothetical protein OF846_003573 [Rhodotorula toruloides]|nr:hypothetical protein OF846_003573 [Rhodotorula toruloides]